MAEPPFRPEFVVVRRPLTEKQKSLMKRQFPRIGDEKTAAEAGHPMHILRTLVRSGWLREKVPATPGSILFPERNIIFKRIR